MLNEWTRERAIPPSRGVAIPPTESEGPFEDNKEISPHQRRGVWGAKELKGLVRQACEELDFLKEEVNGPATNKAWAKAATKASGPESHSQRRRILNKQKDE